MRHMRCPWCGLGLWQATEAPATADFKLTATCPHCGFEYEAKRDPVSGQIIERAIPGRGEQSSEAGNSTVGPPEELPPESQDWIRQHIEDALLQESYGFGSEPETRQE